MVIGGPGTGSLLGGVDAVCDVSCRLDSRGEEGCCELGVAEGVTIEGFVGSCV